MKISLRQFENLLVRAQSVQELDKTLILFLKSYGISGFTFTYLNALKNNKRKLLHEIVSSNLRIWHQHYHAENYDTTDQTHDDLRKSLIPCLWDPLEQLAKARNEKERKIREETIASGVVLGLSIPLHGNQGDHADLSLRQFKGENCLENWQEDKYAWQEAAFYYFHYLRIQLPLLTTVLKEQKFTTREQDCINLLLQNFSTPQIARTLNMTERTVHFHIQNIIRKLGVRNKYEAISRIRFLEEL